MAALRSKSKRVSFDLAPTQYNPASGGLLTDAVRDICLHDIPEAAWLAAHRALTAQASETQPWTPPFKAVRAQRAGNDFAVHGWVNWKYPDSAWRWVPIVIYLSSA